MLAIHGYYTRNQKLEQCFSSPCPTCNGTQFQVWAQRRIFHFCWIPVGVDSTRTFLECSHCHAPFFGDAIPLATRQLLRNPRYAAPFIPLYYTGSFLLVAVALVALPWIAPRMLNNFSVLLLPKQGDIYIVRWREFLAPESTYLYAEVSNDPSSHDFAAMRLEKHEQFKRTFRLYPLAHATAAEACTIALHAAPTGALGPLLTIDVFSLIKAYFDHGVVSDLARAGGDECN